MSQPDEVAEAELKCGICFEILVDPTTLTCGHTVCRYCLAQWWYKSKKSTCPECRQVWHGFPKVNVTLRNTMDLLFKKEVLKRRNTLIEDPNYKKILDKFERHKNQHHHHGNSQGVSWTLICILVALSVLVAVVVSVAVRKFGGLSTKDLMNKSLQDWSTHDVGVWIRGLGEWAQPYEKVFVNTGIDGGLLEVLEEKELEDPSLNITATVHRTKLYKEIKHLKTVLPQNSFGLWKFKERQGEKAMFIMTGIREYPRATLVYLYLFNYRDTFLPLFFCTVTLEGNRTVQEIMRMEENPSKEQWFEFVPRFLLFPYALVGRVAQHFLDINYWTSRVVIMHAVLMTLTEFSKVFSINVREIPYLSLKYFCYVSLGSLFYTVVWPFVPFFIADCIFYWMLYVSPFDALNRFLKTLWSYRNRAAARNDNRENANFGQGATENIDQDIIAQMRTNGLEIDDHQWAEQPNHRNRQWHFDFQWRTGRT